ncbi:hypothetical protein FAEPRAM212_02146 [Faecalibacterium prausnitzii M21/2]|uniref:Uncharacterized protein n=1 Tax=Faecalibacterium prausnitzii M21/2 TaxID=411485 RepID=A8SD82_9FIRM|nr:hypothetical protein FAEPRAM212_02146 [Faecalibacterium prausnitzii M21/2]
MDCSRDTSWLNMKKKPAAVGLRCRFGRFGTFFGEEE